MLPVYRCHFPFLPSHFKFQHVFCMWSRLCAGSWCDLFPSHCACLPNFHDTALASPLTPPWSDPSPFSLLLLFLGNLSKCVILALVPLRLGQSWPRNETEQSSGGEVRRMKVWFWSDSADCVTSEKSIHGSKPSFRQWKMRHKISLGSCQI